MARSGAVGRDEEVVVFNTGAAQKYVEALSRPLPRLGAPDSVDWERLGAGND
jgi:hypothetical protein